MPDIDRYADENLSQWLDSTTPDFCEKEKTLSDVITLSDSVEPDFSDKPAGFLDNLMNLLDAPEIDFSEKTLTVDDTLAIADAFAGKFMLTDASADTLALTSVVKNLMYPMKRVKFVKQERLAFEI